MPREVGWGNSGSWIRICKWAGGEPLSIFFNFVVTKILLCLIAHRRNRTHWKFIRRQSLWKFWWLKRTNRTDWKIIRWQLVWKFRWFNSEWFLRYSHFYKKGNSIFSFNFFYSNRMERFSIRTRRFGDFITRDRPSPNKNELDVPFVHITSI